MAEGFLRHLAEDHFDGYSAGIDPTDEIHPCAVEAMEEVGIDISGQHPKGLSTYLGKIGFNYLIIVCARAEERSETFPGVGTTFSWIFEDPRRDEEIPYDSMLERFRGVRDRIELKMRHRLEHPEQELKKLKEGRERERREAAHRLQDAHRPRHSFDADEQCLGSSKSMPPGARTCRAPREGHCKAPPAAALDLIGTRKEGEDALVHPTEHRHRGDVAAAFEGLGQREVGEDLPRPRENRTGGEERVLFGGEHRHRPPEARELLLGGLPGEVGVQREVPEGGPELADGGAEGGVLGFREQGHRRAPENPLGGM